MNTKQREAEEPTTIRDGHDLRALDNTVWGPGTAERAARAVLAYNGETHYDGKRHSLRFFVERCGAGLPDQFVAWTPYRSVVYEGTSIGAVVASMLHGVARLAYDGSMHPDKPEDMGAPPIQHVINILTERLKWQAERREESVHELSRNAGPEGATPSTKTALVPSLERHNQVIAALGTAIAALARVNDL